ncbi:hypothetical protein MIT9_P0192 [Methylomarinovum caldicuralii]|uniref:Glycosyltransferase n=1 Tax=Methylomarinovum caldicuralii TaxID=438856 RepID=A0AAU9CL97_9GAMM|nr:MJ1255/VC2487 family glycosyltransferase [Methylomarinovum caldicuralii]BCX80618.1 hypothetical protein MIT9_P0192 [Methylomarinovum caldicuralii]
MRILYGVQGTGNGHLTRARVMAPALRAAGIEVQYLFSGRPREKFFDMEVFGDWWWRRGLTFVSRKGRIDYLRTLARVRDLPGFIHDVQALDLRGFDLVLNDFEPVSAWAARLDGVPVIGLGHQQAFRYAIPKCRGGWHARLLLRWYAPAPLGLGLHWHHFGQPILPPLVEPLPVQATDPRRILVYLPFESLADIRRLLLNFPRWRFHVYHSQVPVPYADRNLRFHPFSRDGFQQDLAASAGVICNSGFEFISEALAAGKKILSKPLKGQWEQCCNAKALAELGWGTVMARLDQDTVAAWLESGRAVQVRYPDVAAAIVAWLKAGSGRIDPDWIDAIWRQVEVVAPTGQSAPNRASISQNRPRT